ncbi:hypothetical protein [Pseudonocardia xishanensis]|uniref:TetR family transcriptional regulator n=1 Tax=Pseudonocardia xishanensis TaxID=630995 RepID=A0ABP8RTD1_9PSEU
MAGARRDLETPLTDPPWWRLMMSTISEPVAAQPEALPTEVWRRRLTRMLAVEIRAAIRTETITPAQADQLLARLVLVIDQGTS